MNILFVDDAVATRDLFCIYSASEGHITQTAQDGEEALQILALHREILDVVIMDENMPGLSGLDVVRQLRQRDNMAPIPVILFTAKEKEGFETQALECGVTRVVSTSLVPAAMMTAAREVLGHAGI